MTVGRAGSSPVPGTNFENFNKYSMCKVCKIYSLLSCNFCGNCGKSLNEGKLKNNVFRLKGHLYQIGDQEIQFDDWYVDISDKPIQEIYHHSHDKDFWGSIDKFFYRKIIKSTNPLIHPLK